MQYTFVETVLMRLVDSQLLVSIAMLSSIDTHTSLLHRRTQLRMTNCIGSLPLCCNLIITIDGNSSVSNNSHHHYTILHYKRLHSYLECMKTYISKFFS